MNTSRFKTTLTFLNTTRLQGIHFIYRLFIEPKLISEDARRQEFILNILLLGSFILLTLLDISIFISQIIDGPNYHGAPFWLFSCFVIGFALLILMSRKGFVRLASLILLGSYFLLTTYSAYYWSIVLPTVILGSVIVIVISSILVGIRFSFFMTLALGITVVSITHFQIHGHIPVKLYWKDEPLKTKDAIEISFILTLIALVSWLSNRETERSLTRARTSEQALIYERDSLEIKIEERTKELKQLQMEQVSQLQRIAEFGKLSSGIFHDLMNPLTAVIANVDRLESKPWDLEQNLPEVKQYLEKAVHASRRMGGILDMARKQIRVNHANEVFSLNKELHEAIDMLQYKARQANVTLKVKDPKELTLFGNALKFHQVALNLISNAIDSYDELPETEHQTVHLSLLKRDHQALLKVTDYGCGISKDTQVKIFETFFTTKPSDKGIGIGLSSTKEIVEKEFGGTIHVESTPGKGSTFSVSFNIDKNKDHSKNEPT